MKEKQVTQGVFLGVMRKADLFDKISSEQDPEVQLSIMEKAHPFSLLSDDFAQSLYGKGFNSDSVKSIAKELIPDLDVNQDYYFVRYEKKKSNALR